MLRHGFGEECGWFVGGVRDSRGGVGSFDADTGVAEEIAKGAEFRCVYCVADGLGELWDEKQYEEYNMDAFLAQMKA